MRVDAVGVMMQVVESYNLESKPARVTIHREEMLL